MNWVDEFTSKLHSAHMTPREFCDSVRKAARNALDTHVNDQHLSVDEALVFCDALWRQMRDNGELNPAHYDLVELYMLEWYEEQDE